MITAPPSPVPDLNLGSISSLLDPLETNADFPEPRDPECDFHPFYHPLPISRGTSVPHFSLSGGFRHSGWQRERERVYAALKNVGTGQSRLDRFAQCGSLVTVYRNRENPHLFKLRGNYCRDRWCLPCSLAKSVAIRSNLTDYVKHREIKMLTLTLWSDTESLVDLVKLLYKSFRKLRTTALWRSHVVGGAAMLEVKWNRDKQRWHPHLHILIESSWIDIRLLSAVWKLITKTSFIVHITAIPDQRTLCAYVTKYVGKGLSSFVLKEPERLAEAIYALKGTRTCTTFGAWRCFKLTDIPDMGEWDPVLPMDQLLALAYRHDDNAQHIIDCLCRRYARLSSWLLEESASRSPP